MAVPTDFPHPATLILGDLENLVGGTRATAPTARAHLAGLGRAAGHAPGDLTVVAAHPDLILGVGCDLPFPCQLKVAAPGPDGADRTLLGWASPDWIVRRFDRLVIGSGDHGFADLAGRCQDGGLEVVVVGRQRTIHHRYWQLGCTVRHLEDFLPDGPTEIALAA